MIGVRPFTGGQDRPGIHHAPVLFVTIVSNGVKIRIKMMTKVRIHERRINNILIMTWSRRIGSEELSLLSKICSKKPFISLLLSKTHWSFLYSLKHLQSYDKRKLFDFPLNVIYQLFLLKNIIPIFSSNGIRGSIWYSKTL
jgi:hypothetical protein